MRSLISLVSRIAELGLSNTSREVRRQNLTYLNVLKLLRLERSMREIELSAVPGALLEFGVAQGGSAIILARHAKATGRHFHGYDVFATIPPPTSEHDDALSRQRYQVIASGNAKGIGGNRYYGYEDDLLARVKSSMDRFDVMVDDKQIVLHAGLFEDTWSGDTISEVALAHIDCDWYDPVKFCLDAVSDKLPRGGIIIVDDYHDYAGARAAVDEFVARRSDFVLEPGSNPILRKR